ncbi:hypothetical protein BJ878DRAFT_513274 [Calycina marina]|uniref:Secreted protein n=1 Tax=Calycina marina TaxID=1763456 RepID=A0A9P8CDB7_9HELO|nr:hypothetical protein BJ878DRAFT_513274 [Calycina marina]
MLKVRMVLIPCIFCLAPLPCDLHVHCNAETVRDNEVAGSTVNGSSVFGRDREIYCLGRKCETKEGRRKRGIGE